MKFIKYLTPEQINRLCKVGNKVRIQITATISDGEIVHYLPNGESLTVTCEQIIYQQSSEIRSWSDLFQIGNKLAMYLVDQERESMK